MRGRRPKPTALKLIDGNPGKRALPAVVGVEVSIPEAPAHLSARARAEWDRIVPHLEAAGLVTHLDRSALAMWCDLWGDYVEAREHIAGGVDDGGGYMVRTPNGYETQSPWIGQAKWAFHLLIKCGVEFGFTPSARSRVAALRQPGASDDDPMEAFLRAGRQA